MTIASPFGAPGVYVSTQLIGPSPAPLNVSPSPAGFIGQHYRGPSLAVQCNGWSDFVKFFGGFNPSSSPVLANPYLPYAVYEYFANGGATAWVYRATSSSTPGTSASVTLSDTAATPQNTLSLTTGVLGVAGNVGTWGNDLYVTVSANSSALGKFNINIYYGGSTPKYLVEQWTDLSMNPSDSRYVESVLNSTSQGSIWVHATDLGDATAAPLNAPAAVTGRQFAGGVDPGDPSSADYEALLEYASALPAVQAPFDLVPGVLNINIPGLADTTGLTTPNSVLSQGVAYAQTRPFTFFVIDPPSGQTPAGVIANFLPNVTPASSEAAIYYPWLVSNNPASANLQSTITLPPGGFVLGQFAATDSSRGVWSAPAGIQTVFTNVVKAERQLSQADIAALNENNINSLRTRSNGQVLIWGTRTMESGYASLYVPVQRTLNYVQAALTTLLEFAVFQPNDAVLWSQITAVCTNFLDGMLSLNAFPSTSVKDAFFVTCNSTNNTPQTIGQGVVNTTVGIALQYPAEFVNLIISQFQSTGTTTVSAIT